MSDYNNDADLESEGVPGLKDPINEDEGLIPPRDYPQAVEDHGITADEQTRGPSLDEQRTVLDELERV